jgi:IS4 transposase
VELFFKWIKQHLRIKSFYGTSVNAVKTQIWIAVSVYVLVAIIKKRLKLEHNPHNSADFQCHGIREIVYHTSTYRLRPNE